MKFRNFEVHASPNFQDVQCPKHKIMMMVIPDGWLDIGWYCDECKAPYSLAVVKMRKFNAKNLEAVVKDELAIKEWNSKRPRQK